MLSPEEIDALATRLVSGYQERMVAAIMERLVTALASDGALTVTDLRLLQTAAAMNRDALTGILLAYRDDISAEVRSAVTDALLAADAGDMEVLSRLYPGVVSAGASALFSRIAEETAAGVAAIIARDNLKMVATAQQLWYRVATEAITAWSHGAMPLDRVIARAVTRLAREGLTVIDYRSGVRTSVDAAVRRHVVTQAAQASARMTAKRMEMYGHDLVMVSAHFGARPSHAVWQGKAYSLSGGTPGYPDFASSTGYGTVTGLAGANCRHSFGPYYPGITELPELPEKQNGMTSDEFYEATQRQRALERAVRDTKRDIAALEAAGGDTTVLRLTLGNRQRKLKAYCDTTGLVRQPLREKAYGVLAQPRGL